MALKCFSSVSTARPTHSKIRRACARCVGVARGPRQIAVMPSPTTHGVLGMARTIGLAVPSMVEICVESTPAAIETTSASGRSPAAASAARATGACAGLTHSTTTPAEASRCCTSGSTGDAEVGGHLAAGVGRSRGAPHALRRERAGREQAFQDRAPHHAHADDAEGVAVGEQRDPDPGGRWRSVTVTGPTGIVFSMLCHLAAAAPEISRQGASLNRMALTASPRGDGGPSTIRLSSADVRPSASVTAGGSGQV